MKVNQEIKIRAHHLLCIPRFYRGGYSKPFGKNLKKICFKIRKNPEIKIKVLKKCDDICKKCPHKKGEVCRKRPEINHLIVSQDEKVLKKLKLKERLVHKAKDIFNLSICVFNSKGIERICRGCIFLESCISAGINNSFRRDINKKATSTP